MNLRIKFFSVKKVKTNGRYASNILTSFIILRYVKAFEKLQYGVTRGNSNIAFCNQKNT